MRFAEPQVSVLFGDPQARSAPFAIEAREGQRSYVPPRMAPVFQSAFSGAEPGIAAPLGRAGDRADDAACRAAADVPGDLDVLSGAGAAACDGRAHDSYPRAVPCALWDAYGRVCEPCG